MKKSKLDLGGRIQQLRKQRGFTQDQLAETAGIDSKSLSRLENNRFKPALDTLEGLALALDIPVKEFFEQDGSSPKALRSYLFEKIATATDKELTLFSEAIRRASIKSSRTKR